MIVYVFICALVEETEAFPERQELEEKSLEVCTSWICNNCKSILFLWGILLSL